MSAKELAKAIYNKYMDEFTVESGKSGYSWYDEIDFNYVHDVDACIVDMINRHTSDLVNSDLVNMIKMLFQNNGRFIKKCKL